MSPNTERFSLIERDVHGVLPAYKQIYDEINQANHHGHISEEGHLKKSLRQVLQEVFQKKAVITDSSTRIIAPEDLPMGQDVEVEISDVEQSGPV